MRYHKLKAGNSLAPMSFTKPVTEQDLLHMANQVARKRLAKGSAITLTRWQLNDCKPCFKDESGRETFAVLFLDNQHRVIAPRGVVSRDMTAASASSRGSRALALTVRLSSAPTPIIPLQVYPGPAFPDKQITGRLRNALRAARMSAYG